MGLFRKWSMVFAGVFAGLMPALADQVMGSFSSMAMVQGHCNVVGGNLTLAFGSYDPTSANQANSLDSDSSFGLRCTRGVTATIAMNNGLYANGSARRMSNQAGAYLTYQIYRDASRSSVWSETNTVSYSSAANTPVYLNIYGRIPAGQLDVTAGNYTDTVVMTVTF